MMSAALETAEQLAKTEGIKHLGRQPLIGFIMNLPHEQALRKLTAGLAELARQGSPRRCIDQLEQLPAIGNLPCYPVGNTLWRA